MAKYFLIGVANVFAHNPQNDSLVFSSRTMTNTAVDIKTSNSKLTGGYGNKLQYVYFHTPEMSMSLDEVQFSLPMIAATVGSTINTGAKIWEEENVVLGAGGTGTVSQTPLVTPDIAVTGDIYGYVTDENNIDTKITFTGKNFTLPGGISGENVTVRYYLNNSSVKTMDIPANFIPSKVRLVYDALLGASNTNNASDSSIIGRIQFEIPEAQLDGSNTITMKSNGAAATGLKAMALAHDKGTNQIYGTITQIINQGHWYDDVRMIALENDDIELNTTTTTDQLSVVGIPRTGASFNIQTPDYSDLTFTSSDATKATVSDAGVITKVATTASSCTVTVALTSNPTIKTIANVTITV